MSEIVSTPDTLGGAPRIEGRRIGVHHIAKQVLDAEVAPVQVAADYDLDLADVYRALTYYYDHSDEMRAVRKQRQSIGDLVVADLSAFVHDRRHYILDIPWRSSRLFFRLPDLFLNHFDVEEIRVGVADFHLAGFDLGAFGALSKVTDPLLQIFDLLTERLNTLVDVEYEASTDVSVRE